MKVKRKGGGLSCPERAGGDRNAERDLAVPGGKSQYRTPPPPTHPHASGARPPGEQMTGAEGRSDFSGKQTVPATFLTLKTKAAILMSNPEGKHRCCSGRPALCVGSCP